MKREKNELRKTWRKRCSTLQTREHSKKQHRNARESVATLKAKFPLVSLYAAWCRGKRYCHNGKICNSLRSKGGRMGADFWTNATAQYFQSAKRQGHRWRTIHGLRTRVKSPTCFSFRCLSILNSLILDMYQTVDFCIITMSNSVCFSQGLMQLWITKLI